jgi:hypothetical protein
MPRPGVIHPVDDLFQQIISGHRRIMENPRRLVIKKFFHGLKMSYKEAMQRLKLPRLVGLVLRGVVGRLFEPGQGRVSQGLTERKFATKDHGKGDVALVFIPLLGCNRGYWA